MKAYRDMTPNERTRKKKAQQKRQRERMRRENAELHRRNARLERELDSIARQHHATLSPSCLHDPESVEFEACPALTCTTARAALANTETTAPDATQRPPQDDTEAEGDTAE